MTPASDADYVLKITLGFSLVLNEYYDKSQYMDLLKRTM